MKGLIATLLPKPKTPQSLTSSLPPQGKKERQKEFKKAKSILEKFKKRNQQSLSKNTPINISRHKSRLKHSFIAFGNELYMKRSTKLGEEKMLGGGAEAGVQIVENENGKIFAYIATTNPGENNEQAAGKTPAEEINKKLDRIYIRPQSMESTEDPEKLQSRRINAGNDPDFERIRKQDGNLPKKTVPEKYAGLEEYHGQNLQNYLDENQLNAEQLHHLATLALKAIADFEEKTGYLHMDLALDNMCIKEDENGTMMINLIDFNDARPAKDSSKVEQLLGKADYWPPGTSMHEPKATNQQMVNYAASKVVEFIYQPFDISPLHSDDDNRMNETPEKQLSLLEEKEKKITEVVSSHPQYPSTRMVPHGYKEIIKSSKENLDEYSKKKDKKQMGLILLAIKAKDFIHGILAAHKTNKRKINAANEIKLFISSAHKMREHEGVNFWNSISKSLKKGIRSQKLHDIVKTICQSYYDEKSKSGANTPPDNYQLQRLHFLMEKFHEAYPSYKLDAINQAANSAAHLSAPRDSVKNPKKSSVKGHEDGIQKIENENPTHQSRKDTASKKTKPARVKTTSR